MIPFRVTVSAGDAFHEQISLLAASSCDAVMRTFEILFSDDDVSPEKTGLKIDVRPWRRSE
jgi:hypothetical protein